MNSEFEKDLSFVMGSFIENVLDYAEKSNNELERLQQKNQKLEKEYSYLVQCSFENNRRHFKTLEENKRKIDNLRHQNKQLKEDLEDLKRIVGIRQKRNLISKFDKEYDEEDKKKNPNRDYAGIMPDAEEVYRRYYQLKEQLQQRDEEIKRLNKFIINGKKKVQEVNAHLDKSRFDGFTKSILIMALNEIIYSLNGSDNNE